MGSKFFRTDLLTAYGLSGSTWLLVVGVLIYQILFTFQGLDFTDTGFHLTAYQQIFDHPETVHYSFMFWLSDVLGGLWMKVFPGLWPNRLAAVLVHSFTFGLYFLLLRQLAGANRAAIYTCLSLLFFQYYGFETLNYDSFTIAAYSTAIYSLVRGVWTRSIGLLACGAFVCGVSSYLRITNLAAVGFLPLALLCYWWYHGRSKQLLSVGVVMSATYLLGHMVVLVAMWQLNHLELFLSNMDFVKEMGAAGDSTHGFLPVMLLYMKGWLKVGLAAGLVGVAVVGHRRYGSHAWEKWLIAALAVGWLVLLLLFPTEVWSKMRYLIYGSIVLYSLWTIVEGEKQEAVLALFGLALMAVFPLGSDSGIEKLYFAAGLSTALLFQQGHSWYRNGRLSNDSNSRGVLFAALLGLYIATCLIFGWSHTYFDGGSRLQKAAPVVHKGLRYIYTTPERAAAVEELLSVLSGVVSQGEYLMAFSDIPMVHYLTGTKPYIGTSWPKLYYSPAIFERELLRASGQLSLPVVVLQKMEMRSAWPADSTPQYLDLSVADTLLLDGISSLVHPENRLPEHYAIMLDFIDRHAYQVLWEGDVFRVYIPKG